MGIKNGLRAWGLEGLITMIVLGAGIVMHGQPAQPTNYVVGPHDILLIAVFDQEDLGGKYAVDADGTFTFPLIGRVNVGGFTLRQVEAELKLRLKDGFFKDPQ